MHESNYLCVLSLTLWELIKQSTEIPNPNSVNLSPNTLNYHIGFYSFTFISKVDLKHRARLLERPAISSGRMGLLQVPSIIQYYLY